MIHKQFIYNGNLTMRSEHQSESLSQDGSRTEIKVQSTSFLIYANRRMRANSFAKYFKI